jgi:hypothetical protein
MARQLRQARAMTQAVARWFRYDLPEIVAPSSMPDPPGYQPAPRQSVAELKLVRFHGVPRMQVQRRLPCSHVLFVCFGYGLIRLQKFGRAFRRYLETWDSKKVAAERAARERERTGAAGGPEPEKPEGPTLAEEFGEAGQPVCSPPSICFDCFPHRTAYPNYR